MQLGSTYLGYSALDFGYSYTSMADYTYSREHIDKIKFTVPAMPDDISTALSDLRWHETIYTLNFTYTMPSGEKIIRTENDLKCEKGKTKTYEVDIPEEVQKYKRVDMIVEARDMLKSVSGGSYWNITRTDSHSDFLPNAPQPLSLTAEYRQFDSEAALVWEAFTPSDKYIHASIPYIYRIETNATGTPLSGQSWQKRGTLTEIGTTNSQSYSRH